jgi:hypothetical protein
VFGGDRFAQVRRERGNAALARQVIANECDAFYGGMARVLFHNEIFFLAVATFFIFLDEKRKEAVTLGAASLKLGQIGPSEFNFGLWLASSYIAADYNRPRR